MGDGEHTHRGRLHGRCRRCHNFSRGSANPSRRTAGSGHRRPPGNAGVTDGSGTPATQRQPRHRRTPALPAASSSHHRQETGRRGHGHRASPPAAGPGRGYLEPPRPRLPGTAVGHCCAAGVTWSRGRSPLARPGLPGAAAAHRRPARPPPLIAAERPPGAARPPAPPIAARAPARPARRGAAAAALAQPMGAAGGR